MYGLAVIGGGPAGYVAAARAAGAGISTVLFEKNALGGVCLNEGCIPTKALLHCAKMYEHATGSAKLGVTAESVRIDWSRMLERKTRTVRRLVGGIRVRMRDAGVEVIEGEAVVTGASAPFEISCGDETYRAERILLCTGSSTVVPPIPGLNEAGEGVITSREALCLESLPASVVIIGGGVIGMEFASLFNSLGVAVNVVEMLPKILGPMDGETSEMLRKQYARKGVGFNLGCRVVRIDGTGVIFEDAGGNTRCVEGEKILLSVGRRPNLAGLDALGLECGRGVKVDSHMRTSVSGVWAAGDITGESMLAHTASREAEVAVDDMLGLDAEMRYDAIPSVVYTNPEVAGVGLCSAQAPEGAEIRRLPMTFSGRYMAENDADGICKTISVGGVIRGVQMIGNSSGELISLAGLAVSRGMSSDDFAQLVFPHPTVSEILRETLLSEPVSE